MTTYIIQLWIYGENRFTEPPSDILGPFTRAEVDRTAATLTCEYRIQRIGTTVPEWART